MTSLDKSPDCGFPTTIWPEVFTAARSEQAEALSALDAVLRRYQLPLRVHLEKRFKLTEDAAADYLQGFVEKKVLENGLLSQASQERGRFRTFLLTTLDRFVISELRRSNSQKRSPQSQVEPLHCLTDNDEIHFSEPPSWEFELAWARAVLMHALDQMETECRMKGHTAVWDVFESRLLKPVLENASPVPYEQLVARNGLESPIQAFNTLVTAKRMFARALRTVVEEYAQDHEHSEAELRELRAILARG